MNAADERANSLPALAWYVAVLVFRSQEGAETGEDTLLDHQVRVLRAADPESAYLGALSLGGQAEHTYTNVDEQEVAWEFIGLGQLSELLDEDIVDGTEVFSQLGRSNPGAAIKEKPALDVFWSRANKDRTAGELLDEQMGQVAV